MHNTKQATPSPATEPAPGNGAAPSDETIRQMLSGTRESAKAASELLIRQNAAYRAALDDARRIQTEMKRELIAMGEPANLPGTVTAVELNGQLRATVHVDGMSSVRANVHPQVDLAELRVGAAVYLSQDRSCVLGFSNHCPWKHVGTFEEYLGTEQGLVRFGEHLVPVKLAIEVRDEELERGDRIGFNLDAGVAFVRLPAPETTHLFTNDVPEDDFDQLAGLDSQIRLIKRVIGFPLQHPDTARRFRMGRKRGILLLGPPGNGKTRLARCMANHLGKVLPGVPCRFQNVCGSEDYSMWLGGTERQLKERFAAARRAAKDGPVILFFDEIDAIARLRGTDHGSGAPDRILGTFLGMMDDVQKSLENVLIIAATNRAWALDPALTRPGRLDYKLLIPPPNRRAARSILARYLADYPLSTSLDDLLEPLVQRLFSTSGPYAELVSVRLNDGRRLTIPGRELVSGALLESVVRGAADTAGYREPETRAAETITAEDLAASLDEALCSTARILSSENVKSYLASIPQDAHAVEVRAAAGIGSSYVRVA